MAAARATHTQATTACTNPTTTFINNLPKNMPKNMPKNNKTSSSPIIVFDSSKYKFNKDTDTYVRLEWLEGHSQPRETSIGAFKEFILYLNSISCSPLPCVINPNILIETYKGPTGCRYNKTALKTALWLYHRDFTCALFNCPSTLTLKEFKTLVGKQIIVPDGNTYKLLTFDKTLTAPFDLVRPPLGDISREWFPFKDGDLLPPYSLSTQYTPCSTGKDIHGREIDCLYLKGQKLSLCPNEQPWAKKRCENPICEHRYHLSTYPEYVTLPAMKNNLRNPALSHDDRMRLGKEIDHYNYAISQGKNKAVLIIANHKSTTHHTFENMSTTPPPAKNMYTTPPPAKKNAFPPPVYRLNSKLHMSPLPDFNQLNISSPRLKEHRSTMPKILIPPPNIMASLCPPTPNYDRTCPFDTVLEESDEDEDFAGYLAGTNSLFLEENSCP